MNVPVCIRLANEKLFVSIEGAMRQVRRPFLPFHLIEHIGGDIDLVDLASRTPVRMMKVETNTVHACVVTSREAAKRNVSEPAIYGKGRVFSPKYSDMLYIKSSRWATTYAHTGTLNTLSLDIETQADNTGFPTPDRMGVIMIGAKFNDEPTVVFEATDWGEDRTILGDFLDWFSAKNPDLIATYNGIKFDIPYLCQRMEMHGIDYNRLSRPMIPESGEPFWVPMDYVDSETQAPRYHIHGRVHFDLFTATSSDQKLTGNVKNFKLKTIGRYYGIPVIEEAEIANNRHLLGTDRLRRYQISDTEATHALLGIYLPLQITLADEMSVALKDVVEGPSNYLSMIFNARHLTRLKLIPFEDNARRYSEFVETRHGALYEGAIVQIRKHGLIPWSTKYDFASMYPSCMRTFNLSPDTCWFSGFYPLDPNESAQDAQYSFRRTLDHLIIRIPDRNIGRICEVTIDVTKEGFTTAFLAHSRDRRTEIKKQMKGETDADKLKALDSLQMAVKVGMNSVYGTHGEETASWGDLAIALATTGICRWITRRVLAWMDEHYPGVGTGTPVPAFTGYTGPIVEVDTDGIIVDARIDLDALNSYLDDLIMREFGLVNVLHLEEESFERNGGGGRMFMHRQKNYLVHVPGAPDDMIVHGVAMKSSTKSRIVDQARQAIARAVVVDGITGDALDTIVRSLLDNVRDRPIRDYLMNIKVKGGPSQYKDDTSLPVRLVEAYRERMGSYPDRETLLEYVAIRAEGKAKKSSTAYHVLGPGDFDRDLPIDYRYYGAQIRKIGAVFGIHIIDQTTLFDLPSTRPPSESELDEILSFKRRN